MKLNAQRADEQGIVLIDVLVYVAVFGLVLILAAAVFDKGMRETAGLQRNITDIERALKAGERWRADVRAATAPITTNPQLEALVFSIPQADRKVYYEIYPNEVRRFVDANKPEVVLKGVEHSQMVEERRGKVVGWKWELELEHRRKEARVRPLFTFLAVPGGTR
jgi:hypothetical protein